jgi:dephospho-CoA kinase
LIIGLTGGIATGKSESAKYLKMLNVYTIDADEISRNIITEDITVLNKLVKNLGRNILSSNGNLNRQKLADIIFSDRKSKLIVEKIIHPYVISKINKMIEQKIDKYNNIVIDVPLLFEVGLNRICDKTVVIWVPYDIQIQRLTLRNKFNIEQIEKRIYSQMPIEKKVKLADFIIDNTGSKSDLKKKIEDLHLLLISKNKR